MNNSLKEAIKSIRIFNLQGQLILVPPVSQDQIDLSNLPKGLYTIEIRTKTQEQISSLQKR